LYCLVIGVADAKKTKHQKTNHQNKITQKNPKTKQKPQTAKQNTNKKPTFFQQGRHH